jgi:hypothetical protein
MKSAKTAKKLVSRCAVFFLMLLAQGFMVLPVRAEGFPVINEMIGSNSRMVDEDGDSPDWIEIYNGSGEKISLAGWGLSDKPDKPRKWRFPDVSVAPGEYLIVFASGKGRADPTGRLHTNFKLSEKDQGVYLSDEKGTLRDHINIEKLPRDISYGRNPLTGETEYFPSPTPGKKNDSAAFSPVVKYSVRGGYYVSPLEVSLYTDRDEADIYYTTDGSAPNLASKMYSGPIKIDGNATVRAISLEKGRLPSPPSGQMYFIGFDNKGMAVVSIAVEEEKLWDPERGLLRDISHEKDMLRDKLRVHVSYFAENGELAFSQDATIGVVGASSREVMMRPLKISADASVDPLNDKFRYRLLANDIDEYRHFQLRNNNQDGVRYLDDPECMPTMGMRNALFCELVRGQEGVEIRDDNGPVLVFINGKNYGMMNIGEKRDNTTISDNNPSVKSGDVDLIIIRNDMGLRVERDRIGEGDVHIRRDAKVVYKGYFQDGAAEYEEISESARKSGSTRGVDDFIALDPTDSSQLDPKSFIASIASHVIACNTDFGMNNIAFWRNAPVNRDPGPFHTYSFDFDSIFGLDMWREDYDTLLIYSEDTHLFPAFMAKVEYRHAFIRKIDELLNGPFSPERALPIIDMLEKKMEPWIERHLELWADGKMDKEQWEKNVEHLRKFMSVRPKYVRMFVRDFFELEGYSSVAFSVEPEGKGAIYLDSGIFTFPVEGKGIYANIPMKIRANASRGYSFSHFDIDGDKVGEETFTVTPREGMDIRAVFTKDPEGPAADIVINEVVRSKIQKLVDGDNERQDWVELYNTTDRPLSLKGMYLTDDEDNLTKWTLPDVLLAPGEYLIVFASGKDRFDPSGDLHANFKLSSEPVLLVGTDGKTVTDRVTLEEMESIPKNSSGIRYPDGSSVFMTSTISTPGRANIPGQYPDIGQYPLPRRGDIAVAAEAPVNAYQ